MKSLHLFGWLVLTTAALQGQQYWSTTVPDCSSLSAAGEPHVAAITDSTGKTIGYSCFVSGTFNWLAAGAGWNSSIRVAAPSSGAIGVDYSFYDPSGNDLTLDSRTSGASSITSSSDLNFALFANQPAEVNLLGASSDASHGSLATGSVYATFYCPNAATCGVVLPQLIYAFPTTTLLSVPIAWDTGLWTQWSAEALDDGAGRRVSFVVCNLDSIATNYTVRVFDRTGAQVGSGLTPTIPSGGTYGALLSSVILTPLPSGVFKVFIDGGSLYSAVSVLQFDGTSASSLQVAYDFALSSSSSAVSSLQRPTTRSERVASTPRKAFDSLMK